MLREGRPFDLIDVHLMDSYDNLQEVLRCINVGLLCVQQHPIDRPDMPSVILMLSSERELPQPKPPGYFLENDSQERNQAYTKPRSFSKNTITITTFLGR